MIIDGKGYRTHYPVEGLLLGSDEIPGKGQRGLEEFESKPVLGN